MNTEKKQEIFYSSVMTVIICNAVFSSYVHISCFAYLHRFMEYTIKLFSLAQLINSSEYI